MSRGSQKAHAKLRAKMGKSAKAARASARAASQPRTGIVGVGLTEADLADLQGVIDTLQRPEIIKVPCPPIVADCPSCKTQFNAKGETEHEVDLGLTPERLALAGVIERVLAKTGTATAHFAARDSN